MTCTGGKYYEMNFAEILACSCSVYQCSAANAPNDVKLVSPDGMQIKQKRTLREERKRSILDELNELDELEGTPRKRRALHPNMLGHLANALKEKRAKYRR